MSTTDDIVITISNDEITITISSEIKQDCVILIDNQEDKQEDKQEDNQEEIKNVINQECVILIDEPIEKPIEIDEPIDEAKAEVEMVVESREKSRREILSAFIADIELNGIKQGTTEWLRARKIGGSSVAVFAKDYNPFKCKKDLALDLLGINKFVGDIKTQWGNLMEDVICNFVMIDMQCNIVGTELFVRDEEGIFTYSPDGLGVMYRNGQEQIVLFEFKCPFSRMPSGKMPTYYIPQVKMGLCMIDICEVGLFAEAVIRRCAFADLGFNVSRDMTLVDLPKRPFKSNPLAIGLIAFYCESTRETQIVLEQLQFIFGELSLSNDFGVLSPDIFKQVMVLFNDKKVKVRYGSIITSSKEICNITTDLNGFPRENAIGTLPWKLFRIDYHYVEKDTSYLDDIRGEARDMLQFTDSIKDIPSQKELIYMVNSKFDRVAADEL